MTRNDIIALIKEYSNPVGSIIAYSYGTSDEELAKERYLKCEGQEVSRTDYADLFAKIGTMYGEGDGSTTFKLPDLRGEFLRGTGTNSHSNQGSGATIGTHQDGTEHLLIRSDDNTYGVNTANTNSAVEKNVDSRIGNTGTNSRLFNYSIGVSFTEKSKYTSRPTNTSVLYCIKY